MLPKINFEPILNWSDQHFRNRTFEKNQKIPLRPGLLYIVYQGVVRLTGIIPYNLEEFSDQINHDQEINEPVFLGFIGSGKAFETVESQLLLQLEAYAHIDETSVLWLYWHELELWPHLHQEVAAVFRDQNQRKLIWLSLFGYKRTIDRLWNFLTLIMTEYGQLNDSKYQLAFPLTHAQIASGIGASRVTVTRLMGKLAQKGLISVDDNGLISLSAKIFADDHHYLDKPSDRQEDDHQDEFRS
jgi:hypothetical protein